MRSTLTLFLALLLLGPVYGQKKQKNEAEEPATEEKGLSSSLVSGLKFRSIGPAFMSGRIADFAVNPANRAEYFVAVASGGVWKTVNAGTTFEPVFDGEGAYSIGCVTLDPSNSSVVWVGTGENNGQRSVAYGDGVYKSVDGGKSWKNMGLKASEHIGMIAVDPRDPEVVYVAAQGPLWNEGGERGLYKTTDGGESWENILDISAHTGVSEVHMDPRNPDVLYAAAWQRRRHVWTFISGGPESAVYKSTDAGKSWRKLSSGLPGGDIGRVGMDVSPVNPDVVYAIVEANGKKGGFFRSEDRGESWKKMSDYQTSGNYYQEIFCDPVDVDRVYCMDTYLHFTEDGGKTVKPMGEGNKHVDNHAIWIDPDFPNYALIGCDGGVYESFDYGQHWNFKANLPITQFYKVAVDNAEPFYHVYGGTQDNNSQGGPSRNMSASGIVNSDWYVTNGGDGFESQIDPVDPNIVYAQAQYGWLVRLDKKSGERVFIQPQEGKDEAALRWNWDAPLLISPHEHKRLYFAANKLFKSEDMGSSWTAVSPDLSRQIDRDTLPIMGKVWGLDGVSIHRSTSQYGNIVALDESPLQEGLLYVGTDDGLIQVSENGGENWQQHASFPGVPARTYVNMLLASQHDVSTVYAVFNNHKMGDFKPYLFKSTDRGQSWTAIAGNLPEKGSVYAIAEDHIDPKLLFVGTEFGVFFTNDGGDNWVQLKAGLPTIAVRDIAIQKRENDLVLATFGRSFYILDDYSPLRGLSEETLAKEAHIFPIKDAWQYIEQRPLGRSGKSFQGAAYYTADNPPVASVFTYYLKEAPKTLEALRRAREKELDKASQPIPVPPVDSLRAEDEEEAPYLLFTIFDANKKVVNRIKTSPKKGVNRLDWDFRYPSTGPVRLGNDNSSGGPLAAPGQYYVSLAQYVRGEWTELVEPQPFTVKSLNQRALPEADRQELLAFQRKLGDLYRSVAAAEAMHESLEERVKHLKAAVRLTPSAPMNLTGELEAVEAQLSELNRALNGDPSLSKRERETAPGISERIGMTIYSSYNNTTAPTGTQQQQYELAAELFEPVMEDLKAVVKTVRKLEGQLEGYDAPYTPGRLPLWERE